MSCVSRTSSTPIILAFEALGLDLDQLAACHEGIDNQLEPSGQPFNMALTLNICGRKSWYRLLSATLRRGLLFAVLLALSGLVVGGVSATSPGSANGQQVAAVTGHLAPCCDQSGQKTYHDGSGTHATCAFCVPIPQTFEQVAPATGSENFLQAFAVMLGRNAAPEPYPPKIIPAV